MLAMGLINVFFLFVNNSAILFLLPMLLCFSLSPFLISGIHWSWLSLFIWPQALVRGTAQQRIFAFMMMSFVPYFSSPPKF